MEQNALALWRDIAKDWPSVILAKNADPAKLDGFPYKRGYFRNLITGRQADTSLHCFKVGKYLAVRKEDLVFWLAKRTK